MIQDENEVCLACSRRVWVSVQPGKTTISRALCLIPTGDVEVFDSSNLCIAIVDEYAIKRLSIEAQSVVQT